MSKFFAIFPVLVFSVQTYLEDYAGNRLIL